MNTKYQTKHKNRAMGLFLAFSLVLFNLISPVSVFARDPDADFLVLPVYVPTTGTSGQGDDMQHAYDTTGAYPTYAYYSAAGRSSGAALALVQRANAASGTYDLYAFSHVDSPEVWSWKEVHSYPGTVSYPAASYTLNSTMSGYDDVYYTQLQASTSSFVWDPDIPVYSLGLEAAVSAFSNWAPPSEEQHYVEVPAGYVLYVPTSNTVTVNTEFIQWSDIGTTRDDVPNWSSVSQRYSYAAALPTSEVSFPVPNSNIINWRKDPFAKKNILGQTHFGTASIPAPSSGFLVLYNPLYQQYGQNNNHDLNGTIRAYGTFSDPVKLYPLSGGIITGVGIASDWEESYGSYDGVMDESGNISFLDEDGNPVTPETGGVDEVSPELSLLDVVESFASKVLSLLSSPVSHIQQLISAGSSFMLSLSGLYAWLPPEVSSVVISALVVVVVVGVFKVLL